MQIIVHGVGLVLHFLSKVRISSGASTKAATGGFLYKNTLLKISQNSQENTCARDSFLIKLQTSGLKFYEKRDSGTGVFL